MVSFQVMNFILQSVRKGYQSEILYDATFEWYLPVKETKLIMKIKKEPFLKTKRQMKSKAL
jgi:hypothetical protein